MQKGMAYKAIPYIIYILQKDCCLNTAVFLLIPDR